MIYILWRLNIYFNRYFDNILSMYVDPFHVEFVALRWCHHNLRWKQEQEYLHSCQNYRTLLLTVHCGASWGRMPGRRWRVCPAAGCRGWQPAAWAAPPPRTSPRSWSCWTNQRWVFSRQWPITAHLPRPSLSSRLTSRLPLATLASLRSMEPECEWPML